MSGHIPAAGLAAFAYHGGALDVARRLRPDAPRPWVDLSTGINPHPYPLPDFPSAAWRRLPDGAALAALEAAARPATALGRRRSSPVQAHRR